MKLTLNGTSIPTDGSRHVLITDINTNGESNFEAIVCHLESSEIPGDGFWYLNNGIIPITMDAQTTTGDRGWKTNIYRSMHTLVVRLIRISDAAEEGVFTCHIDENRATVGIHYPSE